MLWDKVCPKVSVFPLASVLFLHSITGGSLKAQTVKKTVWDGAYTEAQATRGANSYSASCLGCHALAPDGRAPLIGDPFWRSFAQKSVGDMLDFISRYMPNGNPNSLTEASYDDITAYILKLNGFPAGTTEVGKTVSGGFEIIKREGGRALPDGALVHVVGCLAKRGSDWVVSKATAPERAETSTPAKDVNRSLGTRTMSLKYLLTRVDSWSGARVSVKGLLIGEDGVNGINVTTIDKDADKCP